MALNVWLRLVASHTAAVLSGIRSPLIVVDKRQTTACLFVWDRRLDSDESKYFGSGLSRGEGSR